MAWRPRALLTGDVTRGSLVPVDGMLPVMAPAVDLSMLDAVAADPTGSLGGAERMAAVRAVRKDRRP